MRCYWIEPLHVYYDHLSRILLEFTDQFVQLLHNAEQSGWLFYQFIWDHADVRKGWAPFLTIRLLI